MAVQMQKPDYLRLLGQSRLVRPLQHVAIQAEIQTFFKNPKEYGFSAALYSELQLAFLDWLKPLCPGVGDFPYFYLTAGTLEALNLEGNLGDEKICLQKGDFNYLQQINPRRVVEIANLDELSSGDKLYVSLPSASDGCIDTASLSNLHERGVTQLWDLAYACTVSTSVPLVFSESVERVYCSLSKMMGEPALRQGFVLSKTPIPVLEFLLEKQYVSLVLASFYIQFFNKFPQSFLNANLRDFQKMAAAELEIESSDCVLLGHTRKADFSYWKRGLTNRIYLGQFMYERFPAVRKDFVFV
ncbi:hypothetical protein K2X05_10235 [bacterium]|nr:hypothetical protein [bacterium]